SADSGMDSLLSLMPEIAAAADDVEVGAVIQRRVCEILGAERVTLFLFDHRLLELRPPFHDDAHPDELIVSLKMGLAGYSAILKRPLNVSDAKTEYFFNRELDSITDFNTERLLAVPVLGDAGEVLGVLQLINKRSGTYAEVDLAATRAVAAELSATGGAGWVLDAVRPQVDRLIQQTQSERGTLFHYDPQRGRLVSIYASGLGETNIRLNLKLGIAGTVALSGESLLLETVQGDLRFDDSHDRRTGFKTRSLMAVALKGGKGELIGVLEAINKSEGSFGQPDLARLEALARPIALMIEDRQLIREQEVQFESLLRVLAASIDAKDTLTAGHSEGVAHYAVAIGRHLGFSDHDIDVLRVAALLHDYGKIGVEDSVLKKPGKLSDDEYRRIKRHASLTRDILDKIKFSRKYRQVPVIAAAHHETLDGSGYADGLRSGEIPYFAKIIAVADVFEALTADRHYRTAMPVEKALGILREGSGSKYDPNIVEALGSFVEQQAGGG
ncbi:MAG TPA: HD domain-containing phosphohydrolase, partial [Gammaproteobacteria bacterium]